MSAAVTFFSRLAAILNRMETALVSILALAAILLVVWETVTRYFAPHLLTDWGAETTIYLVGWALMLTTPQLAAGGRHVSADLLVHRLSERAKRGLDLAAAAIGLVFCCVIAVAGVQMVEFAQFLGETSDSSLQFPMWLFYLAIPVGYGLSALRYLVSLIAGFGALALGPARPSH